MNVPVPFADPGEQEERVRPQFADWWREATGRQLIQWVVVAVLLASMATSRAAGHVLSGPALVAVCGVGAVFVALQSWTGGLYRGAFALLSGATQPCCPEAEGRDRFDAARLWWSAVGWAVFAGVWATAAATLVLVALDGHRVGFLVAFLGLVSLVGGTAVALDAIGSRAGVHAAEVARWRPQVEAAPLRTKAWLHVALPLAVVQGLLNGLLSWVLFHDAVRGAAAAATAPAHRVVLTSGTALADALVVVVVIAALTGGLGAQWGAADALGRRVALDDPEAQDVPASAPFGPQAIVYLAIVGLVLCKVVGAFLPGHPDLLVVGVTRGALAAILAGGAAGLGYVRGATSARAAAIDAAARAAADAPALEVAA